MQLMCNLKCPCCSPCSDPSLSQVMVLEVDRPSPTPTAELVKQPIYRNGATW